MSLTQFITRSEAFAAWVDEWRNRDASRVQALGLPRAARAIVAAGLHRTLQRPLVYVTSSVEGSREMADALSALTGVEALRFVEPNTAFYDTVAPVRDVIAQRSAVLAQLNSAFSTQHSASIVTSPRALMHPTLPAATFERNAHIILRDESFSLESMLAHWVSAGYENEQVVERIGAFSRRGGIIDVWSPAYAQPVRIELFGNIADSIRFFDPGTQRSGASIDRAVITPLDLPQTSEVSKHASLLDYLDRNALLILDDEDELRQAWIELEEKAQREQATIAAARETARHAERYAEELPLQSLPTIAEDGRLPYITWDELSADLPNHPTLILGQSSDSQALSAHPIARSFASAPHFAGQVTPFMEYLKTQVGSGADEQSAAPTVVVVSRQASRLAELWSERNSPIAAQTKIEETPGAGLTFLTGVLPEGFIWNGDWRLEIGETRNSQFSILNSQFILLTDAEIFGYVKPETFIRGRARKAAPESAFADWQIGDAVVHEDYGVGLYRGLVKLTVNTGTAYEPVEGEREYLLLEYADGDRLYVPLHQLDRVTRYVGSDDSRPALDKLGSGGWQQTKQRARGAAADIAREMLKLYAARELAQRPPFSSDTPWQAELESSFPYVETEDQLQAIVDVKADMEKPAPMDRLVVGDVGYGKTEVALRAAFKAVQDGKQVAVLVPTTVLAQQHWNTFSRRLAPFPIKVEMLSRFRTPAEKERVLEQLANGNADIVIGTHALIGGRVKFKDLGLLVIDEEHRFGVTAKEKLKKLRTEVDVITLTATPIPRTLYLGLSGVRAISKIDTPPAERLPIISYVGAFDETIVQQAIRRELDREGQVFFVHNRINTIHLVEQKLRRLVPEATLAVAHGQMDERQLARIMNDFADGKTDILLCTNIIESGLDIPNANTIIIDHADHFGLAELYQLRGRVGRSTIQAYAYFLHDRRARMTAEARERLETLREAAGIGAGYMIAMRDLELRGAGDMLGPKQSGHIASVGFDLYTRLLAHEVAMLRALRDGADLPPDEPKPVTIDLPFTVGLPESTIGDEQLRVQLYRRAASLDSEDKIREFEEELEDRFGKLPQPARNLTYQLRLKLAATALGAQSITTDGNRFTIRADAIEQMNPDRLRRMLGEDALVGRKQVSFLRKGAPEQWKARLMDVVRKLAELKAALPTPSTTPQRQPVRKTATETDEQREQRVPPMTQDNW
jgi:transcription-repair coupling factor (superfamily II helicase)